MNPGQIIPFSFDLSSLVRRSVASLYSHLVTRPTGRALRLGIESQIGEIGDVCLSVLDFTQVLVLDYSCADEAVAKLIQRYQAADRPADAYFVARGLGEQHRDPIEEVLLRHHLALVVRAGGTDTGTIANATPTAAPCAIAAPLISAIEDPNPTATPNPADIPTPVA